jgi:hypothetical protein
MPVFVVPLTLAVNCCFPSTVTVAVVGESLTIIGGMTVTVALFDLVSSAADVAVTRTFAGLGTAAGAKYRPLGDMVPQLVPLQPLPETAQETLVFEVPLTVAVNC